eukprot:UN30204
MLFGWEKLKWCRIQDVDLPHAMFVEASRVLSSCKLSTDQWTRVGLWSGTDVTKPKLYLLPGTRPRVIEGIIEWVRTDQDKGFIEKQIPEVQEAWKIGFQQLHKNVVVKNFKELPGLGRLMRKTIKYSCWFIIHPDTKQFLKPLLNVLLHTLRLTSVVEFEKRETISATKIPKDLAEIVSITDFESFVNKYIKYIGKLDDLTLDTIPPYVWTVWVEQLYHFHRLHILTIKPKTKYLQPQEIAKIKLDLPKNKNLSDKQKTAFKRSNELPILRWKDTILKEIQQEDIIMISASTGSGKSSQVPQWLIDVGPKVHIIVTQPRRLSAIRICDWVSKCRGEVVGGTVGYRIGHGAAKVSPQTQLTFCTAGYLTERLLHQSHYLKKFQYICLDEVHERSLEMDLLLKMVKEYQSEFNYKIVLMSATLNAHILQDYFDVNRRPIEIETQLYPVDVYYSDTVQKLLPSSIPQEIMKTIEYTNNCTIDSRCYGAISRHQVNFVVYLIRVLAQKRSRRFGVSQWYKSYIRCSFKDFRVSFTLLSCCNFTFIRHY